VTAARAWFRPWVLVMFGSIAALVAFRLASSPSKTASESSAAAASGTSTATTEAQPNVAAMPLEDPTAKTQALAPPTPLPTHDPSLDPPTQAAAGSARIPKPATMDTGAASRLPEPDPVLDPATMKARQAKSIAFLEQRIAALEQAARAAETKGDPAEVQRLQDQAVHAKKRLALMRLGTE
jgi:hypothetical protein